MTDFEEVFMPEGEEEIVLDEDAVEVIEIPDTRDRYGNQDCICHCHVSSERSKVQNRIRHCVECGIKVSHTVSTFFFFGISSKNSLTNR